MINKELLKVKDSTSNKASASMIIREILARVLDSSAEKKDPQEHVPSSGWRPEAQRAVSLLLSSRPWKTFAEVCR